MNRKVKLGITLFLIGFIGILSTLTMDLVFPEKIQIVIDKMFTPWEFKLISLINPTILLLIFVIKVEVILLNKMKKYSITSIEYK